MMGAIVGLLCAGQQHQPKPPHRAPIPPHLQQRRLLRGPTAGPGRAPVERLAAFYAAMVDCSSGTSTWRWGRTGARRFATGASGFWRAHVHALLAAAGGPAAGRDALVEVLLAPLAPEVYQYQRQG